MPLIASYMQARYDAQTLIDLWLLAFFSALVLIISRLAKGAN